MPKHPTFAGDFLKLILNATAITNLAVNASSSPVTNLYLSLHTADPGPSGNQTTSEAAYTSYARVAVARTSGGWTVTVSGHTTTVSPVADITFPAATGGSETELYAGIGTASSGSGYLLWSGILHEKIIVTSGITPKIKSFSTLTET